MNRLVIFNPASGQLDSQESLEQIKTVLNKDARSYTIKITQTAKDAEIFAKQAKLEGYDELVVAGGDGTVADATKGLIEANAQLPVNVVPLGTANALARYLNLPLSPQEALEASLAAKITALDVGFIAEAKRYFLIAAGVGFDAQVIAESDRNEKDKHGFSAYFMAMVRQIFQRECQNYTLTLDGKTQEINAHGISIFNIAEFNVSGLTLGKEINSQDAKFDILVFRDPSVLGVLTDLTQLSLGTLFDGIDSTQASNIRISSKETLSVHADGDPLELNNLDISILAKAARFKKAS